MPNKRKPQPLIAIHTHKSDKPVVINVSLLVVGGTIHGIEYNVQNVLAKT